MHDLMSALPLGLRLNRGIETTLCIASSLEAVNLAMARLPAIVACSFKLCSLTFPFAREGGWRRWSTYLWGEALRRWTAALLGELNNCIVQLSHSIINRETTREPCISCSRCPFFPGLFIIPTWGPCNDATFITIMMCVIPDASSNCLHAAAMTT